MSSIEFQLTKLFRARFGAEPEVTMWAPGRVNVIGEHTDYNGGYVLPIAIGKRIYAAAARTGDDTIALCSGNLDGEMVFGADSIQPAGDWGDYPKGVVAELIRRDHPIGGFNAYFLSDLPIGAGVSSSAAMEVVVCYLLQRLFGFDLSPSESALLCQRAEHEFAGTRCGIMDQFVSAAGQGGSALFLDCNTLEHRHIPLSLGDCKFMACDSRVERRLATSEYNRRRAECEEGAAIISARFNGIVALCDTSPSQLEQCSGEIPEIIHRRCRHAVTENARVLAAVEAMERNDPQALGTLMNESHDSLRDDYEVSCPELDLLVSAARSVEGVLGARLTGAGFGGSTISLVERSRIEAFEEVVREAYLREFDREPAFFECAPSDGAARANEV